MRFGRRQHPDRVLPVEITPMIDVVFLLIIFFMTTAQFAKITRAEIDLPRERGEQETEPDEAGVIVNITSKGTIIVADETLTLEGLEDRLAATIGNAPDQSARAVKLLLRADRDADSARLNEVITLLQGMGLSAARVATEVP